MIKQEQEVASYEYTQVQRSHGHNTTAQTQEERGMETRAKPTDKCLIFRLNAMKKKLSNLTCAVALG